MGKEQEVARGENRKSKGIEGGHLKADNATVPGRGKVAHQRTVG